MVARLPPASHYQRRLYNQSLDKTKVICKTCKAASTFIRDHTHNWPRVTPEEVVTHSQAGKRTILFIRDPIDRFISGYEFFRKGNVAAGFITDNAERLKITSKHTEIDEWFELIKKWPNEHWERQIELHTHDGYFLPNELYPVDSLKYLGAPVRNGSPGRQETEWYFRENPALRVQLEEYFADDIRLYNLTKENWEYGTGPRNVF